jgi:serpin B
MDPDRSAEILVQGNGTFALDLYARVKDGEGNRFLSPFSISCALAMTYAGAQEETALQMAKAMHFTLPPGKLHPAFHRLISELNSRTASPSGDKQAAGVQLLTANALWAQTGERILSDFQKRIEINYQGGLEQVDFRRAPADALRTINTWVEERTSGKIKDLLKPGHIDSQTMLILTNAIYFKALWDTPFDEHATAPADFQASDHDPVRVDMMKLTGRFRYLDEKTFQALELPYLGNGQAMVILLPKTNDGLAELEASLSFTMLEGWLKKLSSHRVNVSLPRFKLTAELELKGALSELGMPLAFQPRKADFAGITGTRDFAISAVVHKAFVEVQEKGTEAAAATGVVMKSAAMVPSTPAVFRADHPFFFLIRDTRTGSLLFLGRLVRP